ncbi:hypothetical protein BXZ70DRAFT_1012126 [Cristinia sonorae]|uniref:Uncharacterized protein n=1 Tax=Cristinia sonorae TaxID=1940300 RepID=A0A8K0XKR4_9AGAR|nr:hypothetical protein BXZ70DRAFT_1012126 [Cristinia sonorae]
MALARAGSLLLRQQAARPLTHQTRLASTHAEDPHHHDAHHGQELTFPKENFSSHVWGKAIAVALGVAAFYKFAPSPGEDNYVSRLVEYYKVPAEYWQELNKQHLFLSAASQADTLVIADAKKSPIHRYRYPQSLEQFSPHLQAVGKSVDLSDVVVKGDHE